MHKTKETIKDSMIDGTRSNHEKKETIIDIDQIPIASALSFELKISKQNTEETKNISKEDVISIKEEDTREAVLVNAGEINNQLNTPAVWVQYNQTLDGNTIQSPRKQIDAQRRPSQGERHYTFQGSGHQTYQDPYAGRYEYNALDYNPESRNGFIIMVFTILLVMLTLTFIFNLFVLFSPVLSDFYLSYRKPILLLSISVMIVVSLVPMCCVSYLRRLPWNLIFLILSIVALSNLCAVFTVLLRTELVMLALLATTVTVAVCVFLALTRFDFTSWYLYIIVISVILAVLTTAVILAGMLFGFYFKPLSLAILFIATLVQMIILVMELQVVIGGKAIEIHEDDYVLAAYLLYGSIVNLFLQILAIAANFDLTK